MPSKLPFPLSSPNATMSCRGAREGGRERECVCVILYAKRRGGGGEIDIHAPSAAKLLSSVNPWESGTVVVVIRL